jgi:hypothetical protein
MLFSIQTRKICTGGVAAIVTRHDGVRASYSVHPDRAQAFFAAKRTQAALTRRYKAENRARIRGILDGLRRLPGWPRTSA